MAWKSNGQILFFFKTLCDKRCIDIVQHAILLQFVLVLICSNYIAIDLSPTFGSNCLE
jgi:hypothetical protein